MVIANYVTRSYMDVGEQLMVNLVHGQKSDFYPELLQRIHTILITPNVDLKLHLPR